MLLISTFIALAFVNAVTAAPTTSDNVTLAQDAFKAALSYPGASSGNQQGLVWTK